MMLLPVVMMMRTRRSSKLKLRGSGRMMSLRLRGGKAEEERKAKDERMGQDDEFEAEERT
ncbi:hypothetical protein F2Q69_00010040 [Brassica cretica]|uniref:Uncharacterized protein n=1 Tax=Brassica cretica TaxID=69181 RepID=A0A8S9PJ52_BRACR|nr:hypothetical protein F2Q69_00010040 [Brassica cretica]